MFLFSLLYGRSSTKRDAWTLRFMMLSFSLYIAFTHFSDCSKRLAEVLLEVLILVVCGVTNADCWEATKTIQVDISFQN